MSFNRRSFSRRALAASLGRTLSLGTQSLRGVIVVAGGGAGAGTASVAVVWPIASTCGHSATASCRPNKYSASTSSRKLMVPGLARLLCQSECRPTLRTGTAASPPTKAALNHHHHQRQCQQQQRQQKSTEPVVLLRDEEKKGIVVFEFVKSSK